MTTTTPPPIPPPPPRPTMELPPVGGPPPGSDRPAPPLPQPSLPDPPAPNVVSRFDRWSDPVTIILATVVLGLAALPPYAVRSLVTLPLAMVLPGHALLAALGRPDRSLPAGARLALRVATSLAVISLTVLVVGILFDVDHPAVVAGLVLVVSGCGVAAWFQPLPSRRARLAEPFTQSGVLGGLAVVGALLLVVLAVLLLPEPRVTDYNTLALAGSSRTADSPIVVDGDADPRVRVEVHNGTERTRTYRVIPAIDGGRAWESPEVRLDPGESWTGSVTGPIPDHACVTRLRIALSAGHEDAGVAPLTLYIRNERGDACDER